MSVRRAAAVLVLAATTLAVPGVALWAQGPLGLGVFQANLNPLAFSRTQVDFGDRYLEQEGCTGCHGPFLRGTDAAPTLVGPDFAERWFNGNVYALFRFVTGHAGMQDVYIGLLMAQILSRNGFQAGAVDLPIDAATLRGMGFYQ